LKDHRHPHPHIDPRQPRDGSSPSTNPPVFTWKPLDDGGPYRLIVSRDEALADECTCVEGLTEPAHLPTRAFEPGTYYWRWESGAGEGEVFSFTIEADAAVVEVPPASEWLQALPDGHPSVYIRPEPRAASRQPHPSQPDRVRPPPPHPVPATATPGLS
jgi:hypothetical protein